MRKIFLPLLLVALSPVAHSEGVQEVEIDVLPIGRDRLNKSNNFAGEASHDYRYPDY